MNIEISIHNFKATNFSKPTWCSFCKDFIWGLSRQGYCCANAECKYFSHKKCLTKALLVPCNGNTSVSSNNISAGRAQSPPPPSRSPHKNLPKLKTEPLITVSVPERSDQETTVGYSDGSVELLSKISASQSLPDFQHLSLADSSPSTFPQAARCSDNAASLLAASGDPEIIVKLAQVPQGFSSSSSLGLEDDDQLSDKALDSYPEEILRAKVDSTMVNRLREKLLKEKSKFDKEIIELKDSAFDLDIAKRDLTDRLFRLRALMGILAKSNYTL